MISRCSGPRRKRELGIAAPSPFTYFLSSRAPAFPPARGRGRGRRRQPPGSARPSPQGGAGPRTTGSGSARPSHLPASRCSLRNRQRGRAPLPPLAEAGAGSLGDEKLPPRACSRPTPGLRLSCWRRSRVPAETRPPPSSPLKPPGIWLSPRRFPPTLPAGPQTTRSLLADTAPPLQGPGSSSPRPPRVSMGSQTCSPHKSRLQTRGSRLDTRPPRLAAAHLRPARRLGPAFHPSIPEAAPHPLQGVLGRRPPVPAGDGESPADVWVSTPRLPLGGLRPACHSPASTQGSPSPSPRLFAKQPGSCKPPFRPLKEVAPSPLPWTPRPPSAREQPPPTLGPSLAGARCRGASLPPPPYLSLSSLPGQQPLQTLPAPPVILPLACLKSPCAAAPSPHYTLSKTPLPCLPIPGRLS